MENRAAVFPVDVDVNEAQARRRAVTPPVRFRGLRLPKCRALCAKALGADLDRVPELDGAAATFPSATQITPSNCEPDHKAQSLTSGSLPRTLVTRSASNGRFHGIPRRGRKT
jgi:hypothetical protein